MRFRLPFRWGSVPAPASASTAPAAAAPSRWARVTASAPAWSTEAKAVLPRFEPVRWTAGRQAWNGATASGSFGYLVSSQFPFLVASNSNVIISSEITLTG